jgi:phage N-6-adenine-methyltransferase
LDGHRCGFADRPRRNHGGGAAEIEKWRATLTEGERFRFNHPDACPCRSDGSRGHATRTRLLECFQHYGAEGLPLAAKARVSHRYAKDKNNGNRAKVVPENEPRDDESEPTPVTQADIGTMPEAPKRNAEPPNMSVHFSSKTDLWETPQKFFDQQNAHWRFTLDVCAVAENAKCARYFSPTDDGLKQDWSGHVCWMNPPYGRDIGKWMEKAYKSSLAGATVVCLVPARTDTAWWQDYASKGAIEFLRGRLKFGSAAHAAPFPSAIVSFVGVRTNKGAPIQIVAVGLTVVPVLESPTLSLVTAEEYDAVDDFGKSYELALDTIRERIAGGGPGWPPATDDVIEIASPALAAAIAGMVGVIGDAASYDDEREQNRGASYSANPHGDSGPERGRCLGSWIYTHPDQPNYLRVDKYVAANGDRNFYQYHWNGRRWAKGVKGTYAETKIPYRLPELLAAPPAEPVWICEGEKDADSAAALGLIATTNPGGAKQFQPGLVQWFKGKQTAFILEDNDAAGRDRTAKVLAALTGVVPSIGVVAFPELAEGGDISDWLAQGGNKKLLLARAEQALKQSSKRRAYIATDLSKVKPRAIRWLWWKHLARGALELLAGMPTVGKSQIQCQYVACATTGRTWPNGAPGIIPSRAIMLTAEDNTDDTLVPRLIAAGADRTRVEELKAIRRNDKEELFLLGEDLDVLKQMIRDYGDVGLITIDPITAYMGHAKHFDSHRATDVRSQLSPLKTLAERTGVAISAVTHPPKNVGQRAFDHFIGSQAFIAAARLGHLCLEEMTENDAGGKQPSGRYLFTDAKPSIKAKQPTLVYRIVVVETDYLDPDTGEPIEAPVIRWEGESELSADEAIAASRPGKMKGQNVREFLNDILAGGPVLQKTVIERGAGRGLSYDQLWRAKRMLGVEDFREKGVKGGPSYWAFSQHVPDDTEP